MSSALKPAFSPGPNAPAGQPAASAVANHAAQAHLGQLAQNMAHPSQNMTHVTQNMAQMAQNMSNHGNLSHPASNSHIPSQFPATQPSKPNAPISLVQDKCVEVQPNSGQPLALTRGNEKKEPESNRTQSNGTNELTKVISNATTSNPPTTDNVLAKPAVSIPDSPKVIANPTQNKMPTPTIEATEKNFTSNKQVTSQVQVKQLESVSGSTGVNKPANKAASEEGKKEENTLSVNIDAKPNIIQGTASNTVNTKSDTAGKDKVDGPSPIKNAEKNNATQCSVKEAEKGSKVNITDSISTAPKEPDGKKAEPMKSDKTPTKEQSNTTQVKPTQETTEIIPKLMEANKPEEPIKENKPEFFSETQTDSAKIPAPPVPKSNVPEPVKIAVPKKTEIKPAAPKSTLKLATVTPIVRKRRQESKSPVRSPSEGPSPPKKQPEAVKTDLPSTPTDSRLSKRNRTKVQPYQSPTPDIAMATKLSASAGRSTPTKHVDDKLIVFYKNEYLAVRNAEGGFYVCQTTQNVYRASRKIKIRWLSQDKTLDPSGETYKPDFYDITDMECVLTTLSLTRSPHGGGAQVLKAAEAARAGSILQRALAVEQGGDAPNLQLTEEHPDGLDLSLYTDESQLEKKQSRKRRNSGSSELSESAGTSPAKSPKVAPKTPKKSPKTIAAKTPASAKRKSKPVATPKAKVAPAPAAPSKAAVVPAKGTPTKAKESPMKVVAAKSTPIKTAPAKSTPAKTAKAPAKTPVKKIEKAPPVATPSTSTGKTTRTPRKLPTKK